MNSPASGEDNDDEHCHPKLEVPMTATRLDVYKRGRLAYTETPSEYSCLDKNSRRSPAVLRILFRQLRSLFRNQPQSRFGGPERKHEHTD